MVKRVLYISYDGMTDPLGQSQVIPYLKGLSHIGYRLTIVSAEKKESFSRQGEAIKEILTASNIKWQPVHYSNRFPGISAYTTYQRLRKKALQLEQEQHFDIVHCRSYIPALIGGELKKNSGLKFIFDMRGFWADERVEGGIWNLKHPLYRKAFQFFKKKERTFLQESDAIVSLTAAAKDEILSWKELKIDPGKMNVIPCCADLDFFSEKNIDLKEQQQLRDQLGIRANDFVLCYSGSTGTWYLLKEMLQFFRHLLDKKSNSKFLFITPDEKEKIIAVAAATGIKKESIIVVAAKRDAMPLLLSLSDAAIFFIKNSFSKKASSPTKMGEFMSMGIPVICNDGVGDVGNIMRKSQAGILLSSPDDDLMRAGVKELLESSFRQKEIKAAAAYFFSLEKGIRQYDEIYSSL